MDQDRFVEINHELATLLAHSSLEKLNTLPTRFTHMQNPANVRKNCSRSWRN
jgi:hypothetical protein